MLFLTPSPASRSWLSRGRYGMEGKDKRVFEGSFPRKSHSGRSLKRIPVPAGLLPNRPWERRKRLGRSLLLISINRYGKRIGSLGQPCRLGHFLLKLFVFLQYLTPLLFRSSIAITHWPSFNAHLFRNLTKSSSVLSRVHRWNIQTIRYA